MKTTARKSRRRAHGTREWAASNVNCQTGCEHNCRYCYAKSMAIRFKRATAASWKKPLLRRRDVARGFTRRSGRIMFPTAHDITGRNVKVCLAVLQRMLGADNEALIVSKPHLECMARLGKALKGFAGQVVFRFTIGSADDRVLRYWEPGAPSFGERLACLRLARRLGFRTSVSCEPMLDNRIAAVIAKVRRYVTDSIWLGKANRLRGILRLNCPGDREALRRGEELMAWQDDAAIKALYARYRRDPLIKWKDSIKAVVGLARPTRAGLDV